MTAASLACPHCREPLETRDVLDAGTVAIPESSLLAFRCPRCANAAWARLADGSLAIGADGARFQPAGTALDPTLSVRPEAAWLHCWHAGRYRRYPAKAA